MGWLATDVPVRVRVLGSGAMACLLGARLARLPHVAVTLAGTWPAALEAIARDGITVTEGRPEIEDAAADLSDAADGDADGAHDRDDRSNHDEVWTARVTVVQRSDLRMPADLVLVLVKSHQTADVAPAAAEGLADDGLVLTLQNGLGHAAPLVAAAGAERVAIGVTSAGATLLGPGHVRAGGPGQTTLGTTPATAARVTAAAELLREAGLTVEVTSELAQLQWRKLAVNCAINPLAALEGVPNGALLTAPALRATLVAAAREVSAVATARGTPLDADPAALALDVARRTANNRASMLQDLARGARTEIDAICGAVVQAGTRLGVPTPVNARLWAAVRAREGRPLDVTPVGAGDATGETETIDDSGTTGALDSISEPGAAAGANPADAVVEAKPAEAVVETGAVGESRPAEAIVEATATTTGEVVA